MILSGDRGKVKSVLRKPEVLFTLAFTAFTIVILFLSFRLGFGSMKSPGAGFFPAFVGLFGLTLGIFLLIHYFTSKRASEMDEVTLKKSGLKRFIGMIVTFCAWLIFMPWLGFIIVTFFATFGFAKIMGLEGWWRPILLALGGSVFIYLLFDVWFYADLPRGILG